MSISLPNGTEDIDARYIIKRYDEIIDDINHENYTYVDYLTYDFVNYSNKFNLLYKPAPGSIRFFINGVQYTENTDAFIYNKADNSITWMLTKQNGGFDLKSSFAYMAIYEYYLDDNLSYASIEKAVNALILINPELLRTDFEYDKSKEIEFVNYLAKQISKGNLQYRAIMNLYPDIAKDISNALITDTTRNDYMTDALNVLLLINPKLLYKELLPDEFDVDMIYDYIKYQIKIGAIDEKEFYNRYPQFVMKL